jgi:hypothetical protein
MAMLILEDESHGKGADDCSFYEFDPKNSDVLEKIEAILARPRTERGTKCEHLSELCKTSLDLNTSVDRRLSFIGQLKKRLSSFNKRNGKNSSRRTRSRHSSRYPNRPTGQMPHLSAA